MTQLGDGWEPIPDYLLNDGAWEQLPDELRLEVERQEFLLAYETEIAINASLQIHIQKQERNNQIIQHFFDNIDWEKFFWLLIQFIDSWDQEDRVAITNLALTCRTFNKYINLLCRQLPKLSSGPKLSSNPQPSIQRDKLNIYCNICKLRVPAHPRNYEQHLRGKKHRRNLLLHPNSES